MLVSFKLVEAHPVAKGLAGGRCRTRAGEPVVEALRRRIEQDAQAQMIAWTAEAVSDGTAPAFYWLTLRGGETSPGRSPGRFDPRAGRAVAHLARTK